MHEIQKIGCLKYWVFKEKKKKKDKTHSSTDESVKHICERHFPSISQMHKLIIYQEVVKAFIKKSQYNYLILLCTFSFQGQK